MLFDPTWGRFDLACGVAVSSVFGGPADRTRYPFMRPPRELPRQKTNFVEAQAELCELYARVRRARESDVGDDLDAAAHALSERWSDDWLLRLELLEIATRQGRGRLAARLRRELDTLAADDPDRATLIQRGLAIQ